MPNSYNILLTGELGVGKTTILNLFSEEMILEIDNNLNEIPQKQINFSFLEDLKTCILREIDLNDIHNNFDSYRGVLQDIDIACVITDSTKENIENLREVFLEIKESLPNLKFYIIANFQDRLSVSMSIQDIENILKEKTFGFSGIEEDAKEKMIEIFKEIFKMSFPEESIDVPSMEEKDLDYIWSLVEEARSLEKLGYYLSAADKFSNAASYIKENINEQPKTELIALLYLCQAWKNMVLAEENKEIRNFSDAAMYFNQAHDQLSDKNLKLLAKGNSIFCEAIKFSLAFDKSQEVDKKELYHPKIRILIQEAISLFREGGFEEEAEWARKTLERHVMG